jgi:hypothetical protein
MSQYTIEGLKVFNYYNGDLIVDFGRIFAPDGSIKFNPHHQEYLEWPGYERVHSHFFKEGGDLVSSEMLEALITENNFGPFTDVVKYYYARIAYHHGTFSIEIMWR